MSPEPRISKLSPKLARCLLRALGRPAHDNPARVVVGIVGDIRDSFGAGEPRGALQPMIYVPFEQWPPASFSLVVRTGLPPVELIGTLRRELRALDPQLPMFAVRTMEELLAQARRPLSNLTVVLTFFGLQALLMAGLGVYGVVLFILFSGTANLIPTSP